MGRRSWLVRVHPLYGACVVRDGKEGFSFGYKDDSEPNTDLAQQVATSLNAVEMEFVSLLDRVESLLEMAHNNLEYREGKRVFSEADRNRALEFVSDALYAIRNDPRSPSHTNQGKDGEG